MAFAVILIPIAFYLVRRVLIEAERKPIGSN